jgi:hypothetical protein
LNRLRGIAAAVVEFTALVLLALTAPGCVTPDRLAGAFRGAAETHFNDAPDDALERFNRSVGPLSPTLFSTRFDASDSEVRRYDSAESALAPVSSVESSGDDIVLYVDGAGAGGLLLDWSREMQRGLRDAGFRGDFRQFVWQTGLGAVSDECASVRYKREKARALTDEIRLVRMAHPGGHTHLIAASAGTAVCVFALEALAPDEGVDSVILLSSALSSNYDLTSALGHVRTNAYVFTSPNDALLKLVMPVLGTSDRQFVDARVAGLAGFVRPAVQRSSTGYDKIREISWRSDWTAFGNAGGHTDCTNRAFVKEVIAPLLVSK